MRIGILTFHAAHNYGAVLQCYALQEYLRNLGHDVYVINYRNSKLLAVYDCFRLDRIIKKNPIIMIGRLISEIKLYRKRKIRHNSFEVFINDKLNLTHVKAINENPFHLIIVGSDQVWNFKLTKGFDSYYWGGFVRPKETKLISYGASMQDDWDNSTNSIIREKLHNFDFLSVREISLAKKLQEIICNREITQVVDPTLLVDTDIWYSLAGRKSVKEPYLFCYQVDSNPNLINIARSIAKIKKLRLIILSANVIHENDKSVISASPMDFIRLIKDASLVITSSFHGTIFSVIFKRCFYSVRGVGKNARIETFLDSIGLKERLIDKSPDSITEIDYSTICLSKLRADSKAFVAHVLNKL